MYSTNKRLKLKPNPNADSLNLHDLLEKLDSSYDGNFDSIDDENLNATYSGFFENSNVLVLATSHGRRIQEKLMLDKNNFLIYSGYTFINDFHFNKIREDLFYLLQVKGLKVEKLVIIFGGNDVHHVSTQISFPFTSESDFIEDLLVNGNNSECKPVDPSDPLDMVKHIDPSIYE